MGEGGTGLPGTRQLLALYFSRSLSLSLFLSSKGARALAQARALTRAHATREKEGGKETRKGRRQTKRGREGDGRRPTWYSFMRTSLSAPRKSDGARGRGGRSTWYSFMRTTPMTKTTTNMAAITACRAKENGMCEAPQLPPCRPGRDAQHGPSRRLPHKSGVCACVPQSPPAAPKRAACVPHHNHNHARTLTLARAARPCAPPSPAPQRRKC